MDIVTFLCLTLRMITHIEIWTMPTFLFQTRYNKWKTIAVFVVIVNLVLWIRSNLPETDAIVFSFAYIASIDVYFIYYLYALRGSFMERILACIMFIFLESGCDVAVHMLMTVVFHLNQDFTWKDPVMILPMMLLIMVYPLISAMLIKAWKYIVRGQKGGQNREAGETVSRVPWYFYGLIIGYLGIACMFALFRNIDLMNEEIASVPEIIGMVLGIIASAALLMLVSWQMKRQEKERNLSEIQNYGQQEIRRYHLLKQEVDEIAKVRHDYGNLLETVWSLVEENNPQKEEMLGNLWTTLTENMGGNGNESDHM